jgi:sortase A
MVRFPQRIAPDQDDEENKLLQDLLLAHVPARNDRPVPTSLRSTEEQRRLAFQSFLQRTWVDYALHRVERLLLLVLVGVFGYWLLQSYGYDWLYARGILPPPQPVLDGPPFAFAYPPTAGGYWMELYQRTHTASEEQALALPYTTPATTRPNPMPDYMAPQSIIVAPDPVDQRPHHLRMPTINVTSPVKEVFVENNTWQVAHYAVGYHHGSALPGEVGNTVMAGHAGMYGSIFRDLNKLQGGDDIFVDAGEWRYHYQVRERQRVWPTQVELMAPTPTPVLTLITCTDWDTRRLVVIADLVGSRPLY